MPRLATALKPEITLQFANAEARARVDIVKTYNSLEIKVNGRPLYTLDLFHTAPGNYDDAPDGKPYPQMIVYSSRDGYDEPVTHLRSYQNGETEFIQD